MIISRQGLLSINEVRLQRLLLHLINSQSRHILLFLHLISIERKKYLKAIEEQEKEYCYGIDEKID